MFFGGLAVLALSLSLCDQIYHRRKSRKDQKKESEQSLAQGSSRERDEAQRRTRIRSPSWPRATSRSPTRHSTKDRSLTRKRPLSPSSASRGVDDSRITAGQSGKQSSAHQTPARQGRKGGSAELPNPVGSQAGTQHPHDG
ncbi:hypothetical protein TELCIR_06000 [Teladorsagia circumcincta]|uniref:Uncharacterized protein n=1 Tax=Teladorsagia circumcincta TaxID=45464 RepID=A0A2G9URH3_TELCI|nr:hypothetical protein TELCIR_06000 [Teladorsagia circumcincta]